MSGIPAQAEVVPSDHPRLYFNQQELANLQNLRTSPSHQAIWNGLKSWADAHLGDSAPLVMTDANWDKANSIREYLENMGLVYAMTGDDRYAGAARTWALAVAGWNDWGDEDTASIITVGMAFVYDDLYNYMTTQDKDSVGASIVTHMTPFYREYGGNAGSPSFKAYPNGALIMAGGFGLAGLALEGDYPGAGTWVNFAESLFQTAVRLGGDDGGWFEGPHYATTFEYGIRFLDALKRIKGVNLFDNDFLKQLPYYFIYCTYSNKFMALEDTQRSPWEFEEASFVYRLAAEYNDGYAQWFADQTTGIPANFNDSTAMQAFLWKNPDIIPKTPATLPLTRYFKSIGYVISRAGWGNNDLVFVFKSGTSLGHAHPSQNEFQIYDNGQVLTSGPGSSAVSPLDATWPSNSLLVDGNGQGQEAGDYQSLPPGTEGHINAVDTNNPAFVYMQGDASAVYSGSSGTSTGVAYTLGKLDKWLRTAIFVKNPNYFVIYDDVAASTLEQFDWLLQAPNLDGAAGNLSVSGNTITLSRSNGKLITNILEPQNSIDQIIHYTSDNGAASYLKLYPAQNAQSAKFLAVHFPVVGLGQALTSAEVSVGNLLGVKVTNGNSLDLILFSEDGSPVNEWIELGNSYVPADGNKYEFDGTKVKVSFNNYAVLRLKMQPAKSNLHLVVSLALSTFTILPLAPLSPPWFFVAAYLCIFR